MQNPLTDVDWLYAAMAMSSSNYLPLAEGGIVEIGVLLDPESIISKKEILEQMSFQAQMVLGFVLKEGHYTKRSIVARCRKSQMSIKGIAFALEELRSVLKEICKVNKGPEIIFINSDQKNI